MTASKQYSTANNNFGYVLWMLVYSLVSTFVLAAAAPGFANEMFSVFIGGGFYFLYFLAVCANAAQRKLEFLLQDWLYVLLSQGVFLLLTVMSPWMPLAGVFIVFSFLVYVGFLARLLAGPQQKKTVSPSEAHTIV